MSECNRTEDLDKLFNKPNFTSNARRIFNRPDQNRNSNNPAPQNSTDNDKLDLQMKAAMIDFIARMKWELQPLVTGDSRVPEKPNVVDSKVQEQNVVNAIKKPPPEKPNVISAISEPFTHHNNPDVDQSISQSTESDSEPSLKRFPTVAL